MTAHAVLAWMRAVGLVVAYTVLVVAVAADIGEGRQQRDDIITNQAVLCHNVAALFRVEHAEHIHEQNTRDYPAPPFHLVPCEVIHP